MAYVGLSDREFTVIVCKGLLDFYEYDEISRQQLGKGICKKYKDENRKKLFFSNQELQKTLEKIARKRMIKILNGKIITRSDYMGYSCLMSVVLFNSLGGKLPEEGDCGL